ncbi:MAG: hypothetical protein ACRDKS_12860 [Actinomycetota bacterium]
MVETIFLDWALAFGAGLLFGMAGRGESASVGALMRTRAFKWGLAYLHLGVIAISATLYIIEPAWMWMYWVHPSSVPIVVVILSFLVYEACFFAGFALASEIERRRRNATWWLAGSMFAAITVGEVVSWRRLFHFGSFEEFAAGKAPLGIDFSPFHLEPAMAIVLGPGLLATVAIVMIAVRLWRDDVKRFGRPPGRIREQVPEKVG